ncbi:hypothetical protein [Thermoleptolyngbya sp. M55_K2018_002]|uniref:hypothetical protein n=1 Tax=Thermoleptolyngbya sp. M55_K2018_002 TaxID=2747808 RepID=UPI0019DF6C82|nr:hypothetical protein [Thermoleptolyngbya sp. M55_K2018_002]HIK39783.1 hypothetical protein [Thermoleptolyngbya sp. M55_K2018_002]
MQRHPDKFLNLTQVGNYCLSLAISLVEAHLEDFENRMVELRPRCAGRQSDSPSR